MRSHLCLALVTILATGLLPVGARSQASAPKQAAPTLQAIEVKDPGGQILSFRHLSGSTVVGMRGTPVMPTYHPSYLLRSESLAVKRQVWEDMLQVLEKLNVPITEKQRNYFLKASA